MSYSLGIKQKCGLVLVMSAVVVIAGLLAVISLSVVLVQINSQNQCQLCDDVNMVSRAELSVLQTTVDDLNRTIKSLMKVSLEQDSRIDTIRDSLAMNITMLSNTLADQPSQNGTAVLSGINIFENCHTTIESNCTIVPPTFPGAHPAPCTTYEVLLNQDGKYTLDLRCIRSTETRAASYPLVAILNFGRSDFGDSEIIAECQCYVVVEDNVSNPLFHNVTCGIQVTRCAIPQNITAQFVP